MKAQVRLKNVTIEIEGATPKDLFENFAMACEVFNETNCGLCGSANIRPVHRVVDKYHFYEYQCQENGCFAKLSLGQNNGNEGTLFPNRKLTKEGKPSFKKGEHGPHKGWTKYRGDTKED